MTKGYAHTAQTVKVVPEAHGGSSRRRTWISSAHDCSRRASPVATPRNADQQRSASPADSDASGHSALPGTGAKMPRPPRGGRRAQVGRLIRAIRDSDQAAVEQAVLQLSA